VTAVAGAGTSKGAVVNTEGEGSRIEREDKLRSIILREIDDFREKYEPLTAEEVAWSHAVTAWLPSWCAWADGEPDGTPAPVPRLDASATFATVDEVEASRRDLVEKHWDWRRMWARALGRIAAFAAFESKLPSATDEDRAWVKRVVEDMHTLRTARIRELMLAHSDMRRIDDLDGLEIVHALYGLGEYDEDDLDDELEDELDNEDVSGPEHLSS